MRLFILSILCVLFFGMLGNVTDATDAAYPLEPPDRSSPRATLKTFLDDFNRAVQAWKGGRRAEARQIAERAARCLNLEKEPPSVRYFIGLHAAVYLKETLDRIEIPPTKTFRMRKPSERRILRVGQCLTRKSR
jgi:MscS family membrane protein